MQSITSLQHPLIKHLVKLKKEPSYRLQKKSVLIEGYKMISELSSHVEIKNFLTTKEGVKIKAKSTYLITEAILNKISSLKNSEGFLAEIALPEEQTLENEPFILVLDALSDPGNLGGLLRSGLAFGFKGVFLLNQCADPFNDKALRAAKGATFHLKIQRGSWDQLKEIIHRSNLPVFVADAKGKSFVEIKKPSKAVLIMGSESHGPSVIPEDIKVTTLFLPMSLEVESLNVNVAGSILMYILKNKES